MIRKAAHLLAKPILWKNTIILFALIIIIIFRNTLIAQYVISSMVGYKNVMFGLWRTKNNATMLNCIIYSFIITFGWSWYQQTSDLQKGEWICYERKRKKRRHSQRGSVKFTLLNCFAKGFCNEQTVELRYQNYATNKNPLNVYSIFAMYVVYVLLL